MKTLTYHNLFIIYFYCDQIFGDPQEDMGHVGCDTYGMAFSPYGVIWIWAIFGLIRLSRYAGL